MMEGVNSSMIYLIYCKNICKCYNVSPPSITIKKTKTEQKKKEYILPSEGKKKTTYLA
jgi:hypothetical protein